jgi:hypothetical protein
VTFRSRSEFDPNFAAIGSAVLENVASWIDKYPKVHSRVIGMEVIIVMPASREACPWRYPHLSLLVGISCTVIYTSGYRMAARVKHD